MKANHFFKDSTSMRKKSIFVKKHKRFIKLRNSFCWQIFGIFLFFISLLLAEKTVAQSSPIGISGYCNVLTSTHPDSIGLISPCYDVLELKFKITNLIPNTLNRTKLKLQFPKGYADFSIGNSTFSIDSTCTSVPVITSNNDSSFVEIEFDSTSTGCHYDGDWKVIFRINNCAIKSLNDYNIKFNLSLQSTNQVLHINETPPPLYSNAIDSNNLEYSLNLAKPKLIINKTNLPNGFQSKDTLVFTRFQVVDRYYVIEAQEGLTDYFRLNMKVEEDAEIMLIEALNGNNSFQSKKIIFSDSIPGSGLSGGSNFQILFCNLSDTNIVKPSNITTPVISNSVHQVGVSLADCITQYPANVNYQCLYIDSLSKNYILIHERLRLTKIDGCNFSRSQSDYNLIMYCENLKSNVPDFDSIQSCESFGSSLDIRGEVFTESNLVIQYLINNDTTYQAISTSNGISSNILGVCPGSASIDYAAVIQNSSGPVPNGSPASSGTIELLSLTLSINLKYFSYSSLTYGTQQIIFDSSNSDTTNSIQTITIPFSKIASQVNPNLLNDSLGVLDRLHDYFPVVDSLRSFKYLPVGHRIGFIFHDLHFIGCSDSIVRKELQECGNPNIALLYSSNLTYKNICQMEHTLVFDSMQTTSKPYTNLTNGFSGHATSSALPQDVGTISDSTVVNAEFTKTNKSSYTLHPWQLSNKDYQVDFFSCSTKQYYALFKMPSANYVLPDTIFYTDTDSNKVYFALPAQVNSSNDWRINFNNLSSPSVKFHFVLKVVCRDSTSGFEKFKIDFRETCDASCSDCFLTYGCTEFELLRHCPGYCSSVVQTHNFKMERKTFGWADYAAWALNPTSPPTTAPTQELPQALYKYYPYDRVKITSTKGSIGSDSLIGIPGLSSLYFDLRIDRSNLPIDSTIKPLNIIQGAFTIYDSLGLNPCLPITVTIDSNDVVYIPGILGDTAQPSLIRINVDFPTDTICSGQTLKYLLQNDDYSIDLDADFYLNDLQLPNNYYVVPKITGLYTCYTKDSSGNLSQLHNSCDPYIQPFTYLQIKITKSDTVFSAKDWTHQNFNQCQFLHVISAKIEGGYDNTDDFPHEFRPVLIFPNTFQVVTNYTNSYVSGRFYNDGYCDNNYHDTITGNRTELNVDSMHCFLAVDKTSIMNLSSQLLFEKNCANYNPTSYDTLFNFSIQKYAYSPGSNGYGVLNIGDSLSNDTIAFQYLDTIATDSIVMRFNPLSPYNCVKNPNDSISLDLTFHGGSTYVSNLPHCFVYFPDLIMGNQFLSVILKDASNSIIPPTILLPDSIRIYKIGSLENNTKTHFKLEVKWSSCDWPNYGLPPYQITAYNDLVLKARVANICSSYDSLTSLNYIGCQFSEDSILIKPELASVGILLPINNQAQVVGCEPFFTDIVAQSHGSTITNAFINIDVPSNVALQLNSCRINGKPVPTIPSAIPPTFQFIANYQNFGFNRYIFNLVDTAYIPLGNFYRDSNIIFHIVAKATGIPTYPKTGTDSFRFKYSILGFSGCNDTVKEIEKEFSFRYSNPPIPITITGSDFLCSSNDSLNAITLIATYPDTLFSIFNWGNPGNGSTTSNSPDTLHIWYPGGIYTVTAIDAAGCFLSTSDTVNPVIIAGTIQGPNYVNCPGTNTTLSAVVSGSSPVSYSWTTVDTTSAIHPTVDSTTIYSVKITDLNTGCFDTLTHTVSVNSNNCCGTYPISLKQSDFNQSDTITGNFNLNESVVIGNSVHILLVDCHIIFGAGVTITIDTSGSLTLISDTLEGCTSMWGGIIMLENTGLILGENTLIRNANNGVEVIGNYTTLNAYQTTFENCVRGIYYSQTGIDAYANVYGEFHVNRCSFTSTSSGFATDYDGQTQHGAIPYCGIELKSIQAHVGDGDVTSSLNTFHRLYRGIVTQNAAIEIKSANFDSIIHDIFYRFHEFGDNRWFGSAAIIGASKVTDPALTQYTNSITIDGSGNHAVNIINSVSGVIAYKSNLDAEQVSLDKVDVGLTSQKSNDFLSTTIKKCSINAKTAGIKFVDNYGAQKMEATDNTIHINCLRIGKGILLNEPASGGGDANYLIQFNAITLDTGSVGIHLNGVHYAHVEHNYIAQKSTSPFLRWPTSIGIKIEAGEKAFVKCNNVENIRDNTNTYGLKSSGCQSPQIECNAFYNNGTGISFEGLNADTWLVSNSMESNITGLEIIRNGIIGTQIQHGNQWRNYSGQYGAINTYTFFEDQSEFDVHDSMGHVTSYGIAHGAEYYPIIDSALMNVWFFRYPSGTPASCYESVNNITCKVVANDSLGNDYSFERLIAIDSLTSLIYNNETRSQARLYLYDRLLQDSILLNSDAIFTTFMNLYSSEAIGELSEINAEVASRNIYSPSMTQLLINIDDEQNLLRDSIDFLRAQGDTTGIIDTINVRYLQLEQERRLLFFVINGIRDSILVKAQELNNGWATIITESTTSSPHTPEENQAMVNEYYFSYEQDGIEGLRVHYANLLVIGHLCPIQGGNAVFQARALLELLNDSIEYNDAGVCLDEGIYRLGSPQIEKLNMFILQPNPANNEVKVSIISGDEAIKSIHIHDLLGKLMWQNTNSEKNHTQIISTSAITTGLYVITIETDNGNSNSQKLSIIH